MLARELAEQLLKHPDKEVMILDGFNGGGSPRILNYGPVVDTVRERDTKLSADCEGKEGHLVLLLGYGCY